MTKRKAVLLSGLCLTIAGLWACSDDDGDDDGGDATCHVITMDAMEVCMEVTMDNCMTPCMGRGYTQTQLDDIRDCVGAAADCADVYVCLPECEGGGDSDTDADSDMDMDTDSDGDQ